jgi:hypothetical protein
MTKVRRANGTGTLILGLILTVVGGALLIERIIGRPVWNYLWQFWPLLLIVMGVKILMDHYGARPRRGG